jgi:hypothetical protein
MLFQNESGGLELRDPKTQDFLHAEPEEGALVLNIADVLQRFTNGITSFPRQQHGAYVTDIHRCRLFHLCLSSGVDPQPRHGV